MKPRPENQWKKSQNSSSNQDASKQSSMKIGGKLHTYLDLKELQDRGRITKGEVGEYNLACNIIVSWSDTSTSREKEGCSRLRPFFLRSWRPKWNGFGGVKSPISGPTLVNQKHWSCGEVSIWAILAQKWSETNMSLTQWTWQTLDSKYPSIFRHNLWFGLRNAFYSFKMITIINHSLV